MGRNDWDDLGLLRIIGDAKGWLEMSRDDGG